MRKIAGGVWSRRSLRAGRRWVEFIYVASWCISERMACGNSLKQNKPSTHTAQRNLSEEKTHIYRVRDKQVAETGESKRVISQRSERALGWTSEKENQRLLF